MLRVLGAFVLAAVAVGAFVATVMGISGWWKGRTVREWTAIALLVLAVSVLPTYYFVTPAPAEARCTVEGQIVDINGSPLQGASLVARPMDVFRKNIAIDAYQVDAVATTDAEGRFRGDCSVYPRPYYLAVNFKQFDDPDLGRSEWWGPGPYAYGIEDDREYQFNIEIPVNHVKTNQWPYSDDYRCSDSPWGA